MQRQYGTGVGTLYLEMAAHNETFRRRVEQLLAGWQERTVRGLSLLMAAASPTGRQP